MPIDRWLPVGLEIAPGAHAAGALEDRPDWQLYETREGGRALIVLETLAQRWRDAGLITLDRFSSVTAGRERFLALCVLSQRALAPVGGLPVPEDEAQVRVFVDAILASRKLEPAATLHDGLYVETLARILPIWSGSPGVPDELVLGRWLSGGVNVSAFSLNRVAALTKSITMEQLRPLVDQLRGAGGPVRETAEAVSSDPASVRADLSPTGTAQISSGAAFRLPGRMALESFFNEHVIDIVRNADRYRALGIGFPGAIALHGPPGSGKSHAIERLIEFLGWPSWSIDSSSIGSPFIHETGRKIAQVFDEAMRAAPAVVVIDEMESFLSDRAHAGLAQHRVEEVAEFLRRIPQASKGRVLLIGMTNQIDLIDPAILRRGRFDHVLEVGLPSAEEVRALLVQLLSGIAADSRIDLAPFVEALTGRPLSDASFVVREGARLAARGGASMLGEENLRAALDRLPVATDRQRKLGFH